MDRYVTGSVIRDLREKKGLTQAELAEKLCVSDKAISRWETGKGYPDITLLEPLAAAFDVSIAELLSGNTVNNANTASNVLRSKLYVCPVCGNIIHAMGEVLVSCHGIRLSPLEAEKADERHPVTMERTEDEYYVRIEHEMTKGHYISFMAAFYSDRIQLVKLYPEGNAETRFKINGIRRVYFYCNRDGLFYADVPKPAKRR